MTAFVEDIARKRLRLKLSREYDGLDESFIQKFSSSKTILSLPSESLEHNKMMQAAVDKYSSGTIVGRVAGEVTGTEINRVYFYTSSL